MFTEVVDLLSAAEALPEYWSPKVVAQVNDQYVKVAKIRGQFTWHSHDEEDELFLILRGTLKIHYQDDRIVTLQAGSMHVIPRGVLHNPVADEECLIALVETVSTKHTGNVETAFTKTIEQQLAV